MPDKFFKQFYTVPISISFINGNFIIQLNCNDGEYNSMASLWLQVPEASVRSFFHDPTGK